MHRDLPKTLLKKKNKDQVLDDTPFYMVGEVYNYGISSGQEYDFGDKKVNYLFYLTMNFQKPIQYIIIGQ